MARDEQPPGRGVDEKRRASAHVRAPIATADLVADQTVARGCVGDPQQRLGETHQGDALPRIERELEHQCVDAARAASRTAHALRERCGQLLRRGERLRRELRLDQERLQAQRLVGTVKRGDPPAKAVRRRVVRGEPKRGRTQAVHDARDIVKNSVTGRENRYKTCNFQMTTP